MSTDNEIWKKLSSREKDVWDKWEIVLRPVGGLLTAISVALVGFFGSQYLENLQATETNTRLYAELMSNREKADSDLRKEMFNSIIKAFLESKSPENKDEVLALELLAYNFHDVIDLGPLFIHVESNVKMSPSGDQKKLLDRLEKVAREVAIKQIAALENVGVVRSMDVFFSDLEASSAGINLLEETLRLPSRNSQIQGDERLFIVEVLDMDKDKKELRVRLEIWSSDDHVEADFSVGVGFFDFPMIDNTRLSKGERVAIVLKRWEEGSDAELALVYFPGSRASLKEKPYYEEVVSELVRTRKMLNLPK